MEFDLSRDLSWDLSRRLKSRLKFDLSRDSVFGTGLMFFFFAKLSSVHVKYLI